MTPIPNRALRLIAPLAVIAAGSAHALPSGVASMLPAHYHVLASVAVRPPSSTARFEIVAIGRDGEARRRGEAGAPARPLLIFQIVGNGARLVARNDTVVLKADEGGQCDPFTDADPPLVAKGRYFTVQNGVACGNHWTDYITFRFDDRAGGFVFDNERSENWIFNPSHNPGADSLVRDGPQTVRRPPAGRGVTFSAWRPVP